MNAGITADPWHADPYLEAVEPDPSERTQAAYEHGVEDALGGAPHPDPPRYRTEEEEEAYRAGFASTIPTGPAYAPPLGEAPASLLLPALAMLLLPALRAT